MKESADLLKEKAALSEERFEKLLKILQYQSNSVQELLDYALEEAIGLTKSKIGYIYHYSEKTKQFTLNTWSKDVMAQCSIQQPKTIYDLDKTGIWGEAVRQRKSIMVNNFKAPNPLKKGYPKGHVILEKFLTIPVYRDGAIVAVVGVANKKTDYTQEDIKHLELLLTGVWELVKHKETEEALIKNSEELSRLNNFFIGREAKMAQLKAEIEDLKERQ